MSKKNKITTALTCQTTPSISGTVKMSIYNDHLYQREGEIEREGGGLKKERERETFF